MSKSTYKTDFYTWTQEQAALLKAGKFSEIDLVNLVEEVESMGAREKNELENRLTRVIVELLKVQFQPEKRAAGNSWKYRIDEQRLRLEHHLDESPGLKPLLYLQSPESLEFFSDCYESAVYAAMAETGLDIFPKECPYTLQQILDETFYPDHTPAK